MQEDTKIPFVPQYVYLLLIYLLVGLALIAWLLISQWGEQGHLLSSGAFQISDGYSGLGRLTSSNSPTFIPVLHSTSP